MPDSRRSSSISFLMDSNTTTELPPITPAIIEAFVFGLKIWQIFKYLYVSAFTWMLFDWILTMRQELIFMWFREIRFTSVVFFINRYYHIAAFSVGSWMLLSPDIGLDMCSTVRNFFTFGVGLTPVLIPNILLAIRVHAMYGRNRLLGIFLALFLVGYTSANIHSLVAIIRGPLSLAGFQIQVGCFGTFRNTFSSTAPLIVQNVFDLIILSLILFQGAQKYRLKGGLIDTLVKDGIYYFLAIFTFNFAWMIMTFTTTAAIKPLLAIPATAIMVTMSNRITLSLREKAFSATEPSNEKEISLGTIKFVQGDDNPNQDQEITERDDLGP